MSKQRITLGVLGEKIDRLTELVEGHVLADERRFQALHDLLEGPAGEPGLKGKLDRIEQLEAGRSWHIRALWAAALSGVVAWFVGK